MNLINEETEWEHFSHSLMSCLCCPLFPPSLPVPLFLLQPQKQLVSLSHTRAVTLMGRENWNRKVKDSMSLAIAVLWQPHKYFICLALGFVWLLKKTRLLWLHCLLVFLLLPDFIPPRKKGHGLVTCRGKPREIPDQNGNCQGLEGHHL